MTFLELKQDTYRRTGKPTSPDSTTATRIGAFLNQRQRSLLTEPGLDRLRDGISTFPSVSGTARVALAQAIARVNAIYESTNNRRLTSKSLDWLRTVDPQQTSGTPTVFVPVGYEYVAAQPADASAIYIKSSSASDTGTVYLEGIRSNGQPFTASATMTGVTAVAIGTVTDCLLIEKVFVSTAAVGTLTITEDSGAGSTLAQIRIGAYRPYYYVILLWPTPASAITYGIDFTREILDMVQDTDEPLLPLDFHDLLSMGARMDEYEKTDDERFPIAEKEWNRKFQALQYWLHGDPSARHIPSALSGRIGISDLGGMYPADGYVR